MSGKKWFTYLLILIVIMFIMWILEMFMSTVNDSDLPFGLDVDVWGFLNITF